MSKLRNLIKDQYEYDASLAETIEVRGDTTIFKYSNEKEYFVTCWWYFSSASIERRWECRVASNDLKPNSSGSDVWEIEWDPNPPYFKQVVERQKTFQPYTANRVKLI